MWAKHAIGPVGAFGIYAAERYAEVMFPDVSANVWLAMTIGSSLLLLIILGIIYRPNLIRMTRRLESAWSRRRDKRRESASTSKSLVPFNDGPPKHAAPEPIARLSDEPPQVNGLAAFIIGLRKVQGGLDETSS